MSQDIALITLHGMGQYKPDYYATLEKKLKKKLGQETWGRIYFHPIQYQPLLQDNEDKVWAKMIKQPLDWQELRKFVLFGFSDAVVLEASWRKDQKVYRKVQQEILKAFDSAYAAFGNQVKPVVTLSQSLGCQVLSNYIWDAQSGKGVFSDTDANISPEQDQFRRLSSCHYFVTTGCNIPIFVSGFDQIESFKKPNNNFLWHNFYDKDDALGWPLKPLSKSYDNIVAEDFSINAGGLFPGWNPMNHGKYWGDKNLLNPLASRLQQLINT